MNLHNALQQCRTARRHGKISAEVQQRTLRRLLRGDPDAMETITLRRWGRLMSLRRSIEKDINTKVLALRKARHEIYGSRDDLANPDERQSWVKRLESPPPDPTLTPEWWKAAELRERKKNKAAYK